jgi:hypothetical protein
VSADTRKAENENWFRQVNERLEHRAAANPKAAEFTVVCECAREGCTERITVSFAEYESVRGDARAFVVAPGHADATCERVLSASASHEVVQKFGAAGEVAEAQDPRGDDEP